MISEKKVTKGPWFPEKTKTGKGKVVDSNGFSVCHMTGGSYSRQEEDSKLIAAAPDMLEALELVINRLGRFEKEYIFSKRMALQKARAAIAKAKGEQK